MKRVVFFSPLEEKGHLEIAGLRTLLGCHAAMLVRVCHLGRRQPRFIHESDLSLTPLQAWLDLCGNLVVD